MGRVRMRQVWALPLIILAACTSPPDPRDMEAAQTALLGEAMAYRRCMESNDHLPERCRAERATYEAEQAAFEARYGTAAEINRKF
jgi:hypothetical protein